jgi:LmbE family N-acetylglucosaminyl deacetylase
LVVAAHPDDEVLGCGATVARLVAEGHAVSILILGEGATSREATRRDPSAADVAVLTEASRTAAAILGVRDVVQAGLADNRFDSLDLLDVVKCVERHIERVQPQRVYTHHPGDLNVDHEITARAVLTATRTVPGQVVAELYSFEIPSSTEWSFQRRSPIFTANTFVAIASTLERKIAALAAYQGELRAFPHPRSAEALRAYATRWGSVAGVEAAEAFELIRSVTPPST